MAVTPYVARVDIDAVVATNDGSNIVVTPTALLGTPPRPTSIDFTWALAGLEVGAKVRIRVETVR